MHSPKRSLLKSILALVLGSLSVGLLSAATPFSSKEEKIPPSVSKEIRAEVQRVFGTNSLAGVPLLDGSVDWNWFTNWPNQFTFNGQTYTIRLSELAADTSRLLNSRSEIRPGMAFIASYHDYSDQRPLSIGAVWNENGWLMERSVGFNNADIFSQQFCRDGRLFYYRRKDAKGRDLIDCFNTRGRLIGSSRCEPGEPSIYFWNGRRVQEGTFYQNYYDRNAKAWKPRT